MNTLRKLELAGGILIAAIGVFVGLSFIRLDQQTSERLGESSVSSVVVLLLVYLLPGFVVLLGSFLHAVKARQAGQFLLIIGSLVNVVVFLLFLFSPVPVPYGRLDLFWLSFLSAALAVFVSVISVAAQRQR